MMYSPGWSPGSHTRPKKHFNMKKQQRSMPRAVAPQRGFGGLYSDDEAKDWLKACLDPYHDFSLGSAGLPDERVTPSVVKMHNQSYTLTAPTSAGAGTWDASVLYTGFNSRISGFAAGGMETLPDTRALNVDYDSAVISLGQPFGALNIWAGASGTSMTTGAPTTVGDTNFALGSVSATSDRCRLLAVAFEIHNTTAEIYKQGSLTVAQLTEPPSDTSTIVYHDVGVLGLKDQWYQADRCAPMANTLPPLLAVPGSQTWPLEKGVYAIPRMAVIPRDTGTFGTENNGRIPIMVGSDGKVATPGPLGWYFWDPPANTEQAPTFLPYRPSGFTPIQVFVSGASNQTSLTITLRTIVEYFPLLGSELLPLATPSPAYDPRVFEIYGRIVAEAPYAVPVGQNAGGDYFRKILYALSQALSIGSPYMGAYGSLAKTIGQLGIDRFSAKPVQGGGGRKLN